MHFKFNIDYFIYPITIFLGVALFLTSGYEISIFFIFWVAMMVYCSLDMERRVLLMFFCFTVFVFCMSRIVIPEYYTSSFIESSRMYSFSFRPGTYNFIAKACSIALVASLIGFNSVKSKAKNDLVLEFNPNSQQIAKIRKIAKYLYLLSVLLIVYKIYTRFSYIMIYGYMDSYVSYESGLPSILSKFASTNSLCLYLFLATLPSKKEARPILMVFILISAFSLLTGARTKFVMNLITLMIYLILRNRLNPKDPWLTKKGKLLILLSIPFITALMFIVMLIRGESSTDNLNFGDMVINSIYQQGSIVEVLGLSYENSESIPFRLWSFGRIIDSYGNNFIFQLMGIGKEFKANTADFAINGHSLANYLTYNYQTQRFLAGGGMGSSFIAETWLDLGYFGIAGMSYIYGVILAKFFVWARKNIWICAISFYMVNAIIYAPRAGAGDFISDILSPTYLILLFSIYYFSRTKKYV